MIVALLHAGLGLQAPSEPSPSPTNGDVVVVGSRLPEPQPSARIAADEIDRLQPAATIDLLDRLPGVHATSTAGIGGTSFVSVRGGDPNFTLILIDGVRVNDPSNTQGGGFDFAQLDPAIVESLSLISTSASAVHGSDALGGVISVRLRGAPETGGSASARLQGDSRGAWQGSGSIGLGWDRGSLFLSGGASDSGDLSRGSELSRQQLFGRATQRIGSLGLSAFALRAVTDRSGLTEASGGPLFAALPDRERRETRLTVAGFGLAGDGDRAIQPRINLGWSSQFTDADTPAIPPGTLQGVPAITSRTLFRRFQASASLRYLGGHDLEVAIGGDYQREQGRSRSIIDFGFPVPADFALDRSSVGLFGELRWRPMRAFALTAAVRHDWFGGASETTPRLAASIDPGQGWPRLEATYAEGYKLPSLYALASPLIGNAALRPERSRGHEVRLVQDWDGGEVRLTYFHTRYRDLIDFDVDQFISVNRLRVVVDGAELSVSVRPFAGVEVQANVTYASIGSAVALRSRPSWQGSGRAAWRAAPAWTIELSARWNGSLIDASVPTGTVTLSGHFELGAGAQWEASPHIRVIATIDNILGENWQAAVGFPAPGPLARVSIAGSF